MNHKWLICTLAVIIFVAGCGSADQKMRSVSRVQRIIPPKAPPANFFGPETAREKARKKIEKLLIHDLRLIRSWSEAHWRNTYAGAYYTSQGGGLLVVGYVNKQVERVRAARNLPGIRSAKRIVGFAIKPGRSLEYLRRLPRQVIARARRKGLFYGLMTNYWVNIPKNILYISSNHIRRTKIVLRKLFGVDVPICVVPVPQLEEL